MTNKKKSYGIAPKFEQSGRVSPHLFLISESSGTSTPSSPTLGLRKKTLTDIGIAIIAIIEKEIALIRVRKTNSQSLPEDNLEIFLKCLT